MPLPARTKTLAWTSSMVASAAWHPNPTVNLSVFAGIELNGKLKLKNAQGELLEESSYDPAPIFGATFALRF